MSNNIKNSEKFKELVKDVKICTFITQNENGLNGRPMSTNEADEDGKLWFFTKDDSSVAKDIEANGIALLNYSDPSNNTYVFVKGKAHTSRDKAVMEKLWNPVMKAWFPEGLEDPHMILLHVHPHEAEYWDNSSNKMVVFYNMIKAIVTGNEYKDGGEHGTINL